MKKLVLKWKIIEILKTYSNIASIEMFEAVGKEYWSTFLETIKKSLISDGLASLQIITIRDDKAFEISK